VSGRLHTQAAFVDGRVVGGSGMLSFELTVPGLRPLPMGGVAATGVLATHRRRGLLRGMMQAMFDAALERGEPLAGLSAGEGGIYGRSGFSPATARARWELERSDAALLDAGHPEGTLDLVDAATARAVWPLVHEHVRHSHVGELSPQPDQWAGLSDEASGTDGPLRYLVHRDPRGRADDIANFRLPWSADVDGAGILVAEALHALGPHPYRALWQLLTDFDLTRRVVAPSRPVDEPLRWMLCNPRAMRVTRQSDNLWLRILDLPRALEGRAYDVETRLTISVESDSMCPHNAGTWRLDAAPGGATCTRVDATPDLALDIQSLGSLHLGGMSAHVLAAAGRIRAYRVGALSELTRAFRADPEPFYSFGF
jgi:predicted acetyltransferase